MNYRLNYVDKLRKSGLRPTSQRVKICEFLFNRNETFHFSIDDLSKSLTLKNKKISLATIYNTVHAFLKIGYLKKISINSDKSYYDTNISNHHHFYDEDTNQLIDIEDYDVGPLEINKRIPGKKIKSIEIIVKLINS